MTPIIFTILGEAKPAGSKRGFAIYRGPRSGKREFTGSIAMVDANPNSKAWKQQVKAAATMAYTGKPLECALAVTFIFYRVRPKSHFTSKGALRPAAPWFPTPRPDVLKLARGVEDACTGIIWKDDSLIVDEHLIKLYGDVAKVDITIEEQKMILSPA